MNPRCHYCKADDQPMRPYGPGGTNVCFPCGMNHMEETTSNMQAIFATAAAMGGDYITLTSHGIEPGPREQFSDAVFELNCVAGKWAISWSGVS